MNQIFLVSLLLFATTVQALDLNADEMVAAHNHWRKAVGTPPLTYSAELAKSAQAWASHLQRTNRCKMQHSQPNGDYGENLYWASAITWSDGRRELQVISPEKVVDSWASERTDFNHNSNSCTKGKVCGHYTQLVWNSTTTVGCAAAVCEDSREQVWVCQYQLPGNWVGQKPF